MTTEETPAQSPPSDPMKTVAAAMQSAAATVQEGAANVATRVQQALPGSRRLVSKAAYNGGYYLSYGIVFPTMFLFHVIPGGKTLASGFVDGAVAASDYVHGLRASRENNPPA
ncbi:MAG: hypothetical protein ACKV0T_05610 [Planctomycetales bacterium]